MKNLKPFKWYCMQQFPFIEADYDAVTEWELLQQIGEQCKNLTDAVIEIENYLSDMNLQDEVNNKLDEMAESGELAEIINMFIANTTVVFDTVADMVSSTTLIKNSNCKVLGYYSIADGGEAEYKISDTAGDYAIELDSGLYANFIKPSNNIINIKVFGVKGDGETNDTEATATAFNYIKDNYCTLVNDGAVLIKDTIDITATVPIHLAGKGTYDINFENLGYRGIIIRTSSDVTIEKDLTFNFHSKVQDGLTIYNRDSLSKGNLKIEGTYKNARRGSSEILGGNNILIDGKYDHADFNCTSINVTMATGAGIQGSQGISAIFCVRRVVDGVEYSCSEVHFGENTVVGNVACDDSTYTFDQDGIKIYGSDLVLTIDKNAKFYDCRGRMIKTQCKQSNISGILEFNNYFPVNNAIDIQDGGVLCDGILVYNNYNGEQLGYGASIFRYADNRNISDATEPQDLAIFQNIKYFAKENVNAYRIRKMFRITTSTEIPASNVIIKNIYARGKFYEFVQYSPYARISNIDFDDIYVTDIANDFIQVTTSYESVCSCKCSARNVIQTGTDTNFMKGMNSYCYGLISEFANCRGFIDYLTNENYIDEENEQNEVVSRIMIPKNRLPNISFETTATQEFSNSLIQGLKGRNIVIPAGESVKLSSVIGAYRSKVFIVLGENLRAYGVYATSTGNSITPIVTAVNITLDDTGTGLALSKDENDIYVKNKTSDPRTVAYYEFN